MHLDVVDLRNFYYRTALGRRVQRVLQGHARALWPDTRGMSVAGFGFPAPLLRPFLSDARRVLSLMPAQQGVMPWPSGGANLSALIDETAWPLSTGFVDRMIVLHGLETSERPDALLEEAWRVLAPGGRAAFIVPNRAGIWARRDATPFGYGRPYTTRQLDAQLGRHRFTAERHRAALYAPPSHRPFWLRTGRIWEGLGARLAGRIVAGVLIVEVAKQVFIMPKSGNRASVLGPIEVLGGIARPEPAPQPSGGPVARCKTAC